MGKKTPPDLYYFPTYIFKNRDIAVLESLVTHLKHQGMTYRDIARLLNRDERTIWTTYQRAQKKT